MGRDRPASYNCGPFYNSGFVCLRAGPVRGSSGENEKLLPRISESIRKASFLRYLNFWEKLGRRAASVERKRPVALLLYYRSKQAIAKAAGTDGPGPAGFL